MMAALRWLLRLASSPRYPWFYGTALAGYVGVAALVNLLGSAAERARANAERARAETQSARAEAWKARRMRAWLN